MRRSSVFMLAGAVVLALIAVIIARTILRTPPQQVVAAGPPTTPIVVAAAPLAFGDKVTPDKLKVIAFPVAAVPPGAFHAVPLAVADGQRVALRPIALNEVVVPLAISGSGNRLSMMGVIGPAMRAVAVNVTEPTGVGGLVVPGDRVDVYITRTPPEHAGKTEVSYNQSAVETLSGATTGLGVSTGEGLNALGAALGGASGAKPSGSARRQTAVRSITTPGEKPQPFTDLLVQDARVLAIGQNANVGADKPEIVRTATLEVSPAQGAKLALGSQVGTLTLALRAIADKDRAAIVPLKVEDLHDGPPRLIAVEHVRRAPRPARVVHRAETPMIEVVRGSAKGPETTKYAVPVA